MTDSLTAGSAVSAASVDVPLQVMSVDAAEPRAGFVPLATLGGCEVGVWEHTAGVTTDVEEDEVFVVVSGSATISFDDGTDLRVAAGDVVRLASGMRTTWTVSATLRKIYVCPVANPATPSH